MVEDEAERRLPPPPPHTDPSPPAAPPLSARRVAAPRPLLSALGSPPVEVRKQLRVCAAEEEKQCAVRAAAKEERTGTEGHHHPSPHDASDKDRRDKE